MSDNVKSLEVLQTELTALQTENHTLKKDKETSSAEAEKLKAENDALTKVNAELTEELSKKPVETTAKSGVDVKPTVSTESFSVSNKKYGFVLPAVRYNGQVITSVEVMASKDLQAELVKIKSGFIKAL